MFVSEKRLGLTIGCITLILFAMYTVSRTPSKTTEELHFKKKPYKEKHFERIQQKNFGSSKEKINQNNRIQLEEVESSDKTNFPKKLKNEWHVQKICNIQEEARLQEMTPQELSLIYHNSKKKHIFASQGYLSKPQTMCPYSRRLGNKEDGGWDICVDDSFVPKEPCVVYSFGINYDFSFDNHMAKEYGCHVYSFDPSMKARPARVGDERVHFFLIGLSGFTGYDKKHDWNMSTFRDLQKKFGHENLTIPVVKMDIEFSEWNAIPNMIKTGALERVKQLDVEFHIGVGNKRENRETYVHRLPVLRKLFMYGFRIWQIKRNEHCAFRATFTSQKLVGCHEVSMLNTRFMT